MRDEPPARPIGLFDSGVGGLSVWREVAAQLPNEHVVYFADQANIPYGSKAMDDLVALSEGVTRFLLAQHCKLVAIVCNTASAAALHRLRQQFPDTPFVGMEPAIKPAAENSRTHKVGVLATPATFQGELFASLAERFGNKVELINQVCCGLVDQVEAGRLDTPDTESLLRICLWPMLKAGVDSIVLGCTHYPFLRPLIQRIAGPQVTIIDPSPAVARQIQRVLEQHELQAPAGQKGQHIFYTTHAPAAFAGMLERLTGLTGGDVRPAAWQAGQIAIQT